MGCTVVWLLTSSQFRYAYYVRYSSKPSCNSTLVTKYGNLDQLVRNVLNVEY